MADDLPSPGKGVYLFFEFIALGFALEAIADIAHYGGPWYRWSGSLAGAAGFLWLGIKGPSLKGAFVARLPWVRLKVALAEIEELRKQYPGPFATMTAQYAASQSKLKIHSASWGSASSRQPVLDAVDRQPKDGLVLGVSNEVLGCDPAWGNDNKYIEVEYSYGDGPMQKVSRRQGRLLILPEDRQSIEETAAEYERKRVSDLEAQAAELIAEIDKIPQQVVEENSHLWEWVGTMRQLVVDASLLKEGLSRLEYEWSKSGDRLDLPLADSTIPEPGKPLSWNQRELLGYRFLYREHLERVRIWAPDFASVLMNAGFPNGLDTYRTKQALQLHSDDLTAHIVKILKSPTNVP